MKRLFLQLVMVLLAGACGRTVQVATSPVDHVGKAIPFAEADALLRAVLEANDSYRGLETVHRVTLELSLDGQRSEKQIFTAALAVRRPAEFRLQLLGPMGAKAMDVLYRSGQTQVLQVASELQRSSRLPSVIQSVAGDIAAMFRLDPQPRSTRRSLEESLSLASGRAPLYELREYAGDVLVRQLTVFASSLAVARCELSDGRGGSRVITYGDYKRRGGLLLPTSFLLQREGELSYWLSIRVDSVSIDPELDERLFQGGGGGG